MKVNIEEMTKKFNNLRLSSQNKNFSRAEVFKALKNIGINSGIAEKMSKNTQFFEKRRDGVRVNYYFKKDPVYKGLMESIYKQYNEGHKKYSNMKEIGEEEKAIALLKSRGYELKKIVGIDEEALRKDLPNVYKKYAIIENVQCQYCFRFIRFAKIE